MADNAKISLEPLRQRLSEYAGVISGFLKADVEIVGEDMRRIAGTGRFASPAAPTISGGLIYRELFGENTYVIINTPRRHTVCAACPGISRCLVAMEAAFPLTYRERAIVAVGTVCDDYGQKEAMLGGIGAHVNLLNAVSGMLERELNLIEAGKAKPNASEVIQPKPAEISHSERTILTLAEMERAAIINALRTCGRDTQGKRLAAEQLGIGVATLYRKIGEYGIGNEDIT